MSGIALEKKFEEFIAVNNVNCRSSTIDEAVGAASLFVKTDDREGEIGGLVTYNSARYERSEMSFLSSPIRLSATTGLVVAALLVRPASSTHQATPAEYAGVEWPFYGL